MPITGTSKNGGTCEYRSLAIMSGNDEAIAQAAWLTLNWQVDLGGVSCHDLCIRKGRDNNRIMNLMLDFHLYT
jgi:hypothetical protein